MRHSSRHQMLQLVRIQPLWFKYIVFSLLTVLLGTADYVTGDLSIVIFYMVPISGAVWLIDGKGGRVIALQAAVEVIATAVLLTPAGSSFLSLRIWNSVMEAFFLLFTSYLLQELKKAFQKNKQRAEELQDANRELEAFNYTVSHDLKNPISIVLGYCELILGNTPSLEECRTRIMEVEKATLRMDTLIDTLLTFSRLSHRKLERKTVDVANLARIVALELQMSAPAKKVVFEVAEGMTAHADPALLRLVLGNLLGNAWKYTGKRQEAVIKVGMEETAAGKAFFVSDNGEGFDMKDAERLFVPFQRLKGVEEFRGHGIGLATVARIIHRHGGKVWAAGEPGGGATFYFTLGENSSAETQA